jgi:hypothetical protein
MYSLNDYDLTDSQVDLALDKLHDQAFAAQQKESSLIDAHQSGGYLTAALELVYSE